LPPMSTPFPYTTLFRSDAPGAGERVDVAGAGALGQYRWLVRADDRAGTGHGVFLAAPLGLRGRDAAGAAGVAVAGVAASSVGARSEEHTSELQSPYDLV